MKKVLVAEDDKFLANAYRIKLAKAGFEIKLATDGQEVIEALKTYTPDIMLLDLVMPIRDGFSALEEIKANEQWKHIPVIVASNLGQKEDTERAQKLGAADVVVKSDLSLDELVEKVNKLLGSS